MGETTEVRRLAYRTVRVVLRHKNEQYRKTVSCVDVNTAQGVFDTLRTGDAILRFYITTVQDG